MSDDTKMTKTKRKEIIREMILGYEIGERFSGIDTKRFGEICGYTFEWVERVAPNQGNAPAVYVSWPDENYIGSWSWVRSINGYDKRQNLLSAMRVASQAGTFRRVTKVACVQCGGIDQLAVDHKNTPFSKIARQFITQHGEPEIKNVDFGWRLVDPIPFLTFHDAIADYQVLCVSCNSKKGAMT